MTTVLIVEDDPMQRQLYTALVSAMDFTPLSASDAQTALELAKTNEVDVILTDLDMPQMNGDKFRAELLQIESLKDIPVVAMTAMSHKCNFFVEAKFQSHIKKPAMVIQIMDILKSVLSEKMAGVGLDEISHTCNCRGT